MPVKLPPEIILSCLAHLPPADKATVPTLLAVSESSSSLLALARANVLWRPIADWLYHLHRPRSQKVFDEAQKEGEDDDVFFRYCRLRTLKNQRAKALVPQIQEPRNRLPLVEELRDSLGGDVVERLQPDLIKEEMNPRDWLSLRYWTGEMRKTLLRTEAIATWDALVKRDEAEEEAEDDFEQGTNAFAAFRGLDPTLLPVHRYNTEVNPFLLETLDDPPPQGPRQLEWLANKVTTYMHDIHLQAARDGSFHDLDGHFVELVWREAESEPDAGTLPMTLVSIFCSLVRRLPLAKSLKISAKAVGFPGTVLACLIYDNSPERIFVNVFSNGTILGVETLKSMLRALGHPISAEFFRPATAREMCLRVARNILTSVRHGERRHGEPISHEDATSTLYAAAHAFFLLTNRNDVDDDQFETYADWLVSLCQAEYPLDVSFLEQRVIPLLPPRRRAAVEGLCEALREDDQAEKEKKWVNGEIKWRIGTVFHHRLFNYVAVIRGWDYKCEASEQWIQQMQVDRLPFGRNQPFYHVIVEDGSSRYVASENITIPPPAANGDNICDSAVPVLLLDESIGRYFCRRERNEEGRWVFVPSKEVEAEYPDS
ncbi:hypothetical protein JCM6882_000073 [Rhodosporidiobolus microsporus]